MHILVALRKESVDRNSYFYIIKITVCRSLSARRAWIEIGCTLRQLQFALSLSARRAWIEISGLKRSIPDVGCRSPQGERG